MLSTMSLSSMLSIFEEGQEGLRSYAEELAFVDREDGVGLEGAIIRPIGATRPVAVIWIHGNTSKFYDLPYMQIGREMATLGYTFVTANTHGHSVVSPACGECDIILDGICRETFEDTPLDIKAWIDMAIEEGFAGVVLVGHSFGANKIIYYQAEQQDPRVRGIASASGDVRWKAAPERTEFAEQKEREGRAEEMLSQLDAPWYPMSAKAYLGRARVAQHVFRSETRTPYIAEVKSPILAFYGSEEEWCGSDSELDIVRVNARSSVRVDTAIVDGADHVYWDKAHAVARLIGDWVEEIAAA